MKIKSKPYLKRINLSAICLKQSVDVKLLTFNKSNQFLTKVFYFKFLVCLIYDVFKTQTFNNFSKKIISKRSYKKTYAYKLTYV